MALKILCLFTFLTFSQAGVLPLFDPRIVNGADAKLGEIPYQVSLQEKNSSFHFCSGSILNDNYVITAAQCVAHGKIASELKVVAGTINLRDPKSEHNIEKIIVHEKYDPYDSWKNDIALLKVSTPFKTSASLGHVSLPSKDHVIKGNDLAFVSGWGNLWLGGPTTPKLQKVAIRIAEQAYCRFIYKFAYKFVKLTVHPTHVCAFNSSAEKGPCHGDSGGPLTVDGKLVGIVSWVLPCASTSFPTVYTRVDSYLDWIKDHAI